MRSRRILPALVMGGAVAVVACSDAQLDPAVHPACDQTAAADASPGAATVQGLVAQLGPGDTGCLREGTYAVDGQVTIDDPRVTLASFPGERATIVGRIVIEPAAEGARLEDLVLDGRNPERLPSPTVHASGVVLAGNEIFNDNTAICVNVDDYGDRPAPEGVVIERNRIHDCGELPATNRHHGIYLAETRGTVIRENWIYDNADRGIQLYPDADGTRITGNVIDRNGEGIIVSGDEDDTSDHNLVSGNAITNSTIRYNVEADWPGAVGAGNIVRGNCLYGGAWGEEQGGIETPHEGFIAEDNQVAEPTYIDAPAGDYRQSEPGSCRLPLGYPIPG